MVNWYKRAMPLHPKSLDEQGMTIYDIGHKQFNNKLLGESEKEGIWAIRNNFIVVDVPVGPENKNDSHAKLGLSGHRSFIAKGRYSIKDGQTVVSMQLMPDNPMVFQQSPARKKWVKAKIEEELDRYFDNPKIIQSRTDF